MKISTVKVDNIDFWGKICQKWQKKHHCNKVFHLPRKSLTKYKVLGKIKLKLNQWHFNVSTPIIDNFKSYNMVYFGKKSHAFLWSIYDKKYAKIKFFWGLFFSYIIYLFILNNRIQEILCIFFSKIRKKSYQ